MTNGQEQVARLMEVIDAAIIDAQQGAGRCNRRKFEAALRAGLQESFAAGMSCRPASVQGEPVGHLYTIAGKQHCTIERVLPDGPLYTTPQPATPQPAAVQGEPVGILRYDYKGRYVHHCIDMLNDDVPDGAPLYTTPQPAQEGDAKDALLAEVDMLKSENQEVKRLRDSWEKEARELLAERDARSQPVSDKLLQIIAATYQILGVYDAPAHVLDVLADPLGATQKEVDAMLPFEQPATERNFCERCGKRLGDIDSIHTCTPPADQAMTIAMMKLAQEPESVWVAEDTSPQFMPNGSKRRIWWECVEGVGTQLFTAPQRQPLTVQEVEQILHQHNYEVHGDRARYIVRMTEEAHGITTTPQGNQ